MDNLSNLAETTVNERCTESSRLLDFDLSLETGCKSTPRRSSLPLNSAPQLGIGFKSPRPCSISTERDDSLPQLGFQAPQKTKQGVTRWEEVTGTTSSGTLLRSNFKALTKSPLTTVWQLPQTNTSETPEWMKKLKSRTGGGGNDDAEATADNNILECKLHLMALKSETLKEIKGLTNQRFDTFKGAGPTEWRKATEVLGHDAHGEAHDNIPEWMWKRKLMQMKRETLNEMRHLTDKQSEASSGLDSRHVKNTGTSEALPSDNKLVVSGGDSSIPKSWTKTTDEREKQPSGDEPSTPACKRSLLKNRLVQVELLALGQQTNKDHVRNDREGGGPELMKKFQSIQFRQEVVLEVGGIVTNGTGVSSRYRRTVAISKSDSQVVSSMRTSSKSTKELSSMNTDSECIGTKAKYANSEVDQTTFIETFNESKISSFQGAPFISTPVVTDDFVASERAEETEFPQVIDCRAEGQGDPSESFNSKEEPPTVYSGRDFHVEEDPSRQVSLSHAEDAFSDRHTRKESKCLSIASVTTVVGEPIASPKRKKKKKVDINGETTGLMNESFRNKEEPTSVHSGKDSNCESRASVTTASSSSVELVKSEKTNKKKKDDIHGTSAELMRESFSSDGQRTAYSGKDSHVEGDLRQEVSLSQAENASSYKHYMDESTCQSSASETAGMGQPLACPKRKKKKKVDIDHDGDPPCERADLMHESFSSKEEPQSVRRGKDFNCESRVSGSTGSSSSGERNKERNSMIRRINRVNSAKKKKKTKAGIDDTSAEMMHESFNSKEESPSVQSCKDSKCESKTSRTAASSSSGIPITSPDLIKKKSTKDEEKEKIRKTLTAFLERNISRTLEEKPRHSRNRTRGIGGLPRSSSRDELMPVKQGSSAASGASSDEKNKRRSPRKTPRRSTIKRESGDCKLLPDPENTASPTKHRSRQDQRRSPRRQSSRRSSEKVALPAIKDDEEGDEIFYVISRHTEFRSSMQKITLPMDFDEFACDDFSTVDNNHARALVSIQKGATKEKPFAKHFSNGMENGDKAEEHVDVDPFVASGKKDTDGVDFTSPFKDFGDSFALEDGSGHGSGLNSVFDGSGSFGTGDGSRLSAAFSDSFGTGDGSRLSAAFSDSFGTGDGSRLSAAFSDSLSAAFGDSFRMGDSDCLDGTESGDLGVTRVDLCADFGDNFVAGDGSHFRALFSDSVVDGDDSRPVSAFCDSLRMGENDCLDGPEFVKFSSNTREGGCETGRESERSRYNTSVPASSPKKERRRVAEGGTTPRSPQKPATTKNDGLDERRRSLRTSKSRSSNSHLSKEQA